MNSQELRVLQEAYNQVYAPQELDEGYMPPTQKRADKMMKQSSKLHRTGSERGDFGHPEAEKKHTQASKIAFMSRRMSDKAKERDKESKKSEFNVKEDLYDRILTHSLDEAEGSYGQTPKAQQKMGELTNKRRNTPASEYSERGEKKKKVDAASKHFNRMGNPDAGDRSKKSTKPHWTSGSRKGMTQKDRDWSRGADEYGHSSYDPDWNGPASGPGGKPKGKKAERQKKTGVSAESFDLYDVILSHLLDEGYASTEESADKIILNMSESWFEEIVEARRSEKEGKGSPESPLSYPGRETQQTRGQMGGRHYQSGGEGGSKTERGRKKSDKYSQSQRLRGLSTYPEKPGKYAEMQRKRRGGDIGSRYD